MRQQLPLDWSAVEPSTLVVAPSSHPQARETSALAAVANRDVIKALIVPN